MSNVLPLRDIIFGKTDAFNELKEFGIDWFIKAFFPYEKYEIDSFVRGNSYFICGEKGTGKTAFLRYLQCVLSEDTTSLIIPIRFKSDIDNEERKSMVRASINIKEVEAEGLNEFKEGDAITVWQIYILNKLFSKISEAGEYDFFKQTKEYSEIKQLLKVVYPEYKDNIVPRIKKGQLKVNAHLLEMLDAELQLEIGAEERVATINFNRVAKTIISKFSKLCYNKSKVYILFDELELSIQSEKSHLRDIKLVRDLIIAIERLNEICKEKQFDIHIVCSVRTEVLKSVHSAGYEINKCIEDYGIMMSWYQKGGNYEDNKLLKLIENKIIASEEIHGICEHGDIWEKYFPDEINNVPTKRYILNYCWMHPRDIVRLMNNVQRQCNDESKFTQEMFDRAMKDYSSASWTEITEGLSLKYSSEDIQIIKRLLTNVEVPFSYQYLMRRIEELSKMDPRYREFSNRHMLLSVLDDLFSFGVIGNTGRRMIFKFMEDDDLAPTENMIIHKPLRNFFAVQSRKATMLDIYDN